MPTQGERIAGFILITGIDGIRYVLRQHAVSVVSDLDPAQDETLIQLHGGTVVRVLLETLASSVPHCRGVSRSALPPISDGPRATPEAVALTLSPKFSQPIP